MLNIVIYINFFFFLSFQHRNDKNQYTLLLFLLNRIIIAMLFTYNLSNIIFFLVKQFYIYIFFSSKIKVDLITNSHFLTLASTFLVDEPFFIL